MLQSNRGDYMENKESNYLRELIRVLVRNLGILEKSDSNCCGVTISQCHAIVEVGRVGEISLNELAELLTLDKSTMSRTINNLVEDGLVVRELHPEDRRYITIKLTDEGINQRGTHDDLIMQEGLYSNLYNMQFKQIDQN